MTMVTRSQWLNDKQVGWMRAWTARNEMSREYAMNERRIRDEELANAAHCKAPPRSSPSAVTDKASSACWNDKYRA
eukprot:CAMPEP_0185833736 /NCGR_PEP_ID=MMETSP1353-20130828/3361_1 /TAXON_ID=1077150 /ORGANISM="Erythrolobus australicus, Strain CCMP3124" /LENGTH=75 /DNA_ID=CAMNT_0028532059 /DNA_START=94 /DNA_END=319 /DNA_ORIENTATION=-